MLHVLLNAVLDYEYKLLIAGNSVTLPNLNRLGNVTEYTYEARYPTCGNINTDPSLMYDLMR